MFRLIPKPIHRSALRVAYRLRHRWRRWRGETGTGVSVIGRDFDGQVLLIRHSYGPPGWFFPGGGLGRKEAPIDGARRELHEETGCTIEGLREIGVVDETLSGLPHKSHLFEGFINDMPRADGREVIEARFFPTHSLPEPLAERTRVRLAMWQARRD